ncbi:MAG TPA: 2,3-bisphosphoglycerate-independent phosphoglycerate mutase [Firmicutes bacterium]|jgi:2,3-bisphosphoglycerate-independent phosphoglycerate mutase|nr:2,3-bisphosphoglycerate-independent phosphoglycerate mutase [Candidatus Fermentithermobacillaceae bacterium]
MKVARPRPVVLVILDGWGLSDCTTQTAVSQANTENMTKLMQQYPSTCLEAAGEAVGLMPGQMGDSNVGHLNIGAGRIVYQDLVRISNDIKRGAFFENPVLLDAIENVKRNSSALHLMGLVSDGGVHSHQEHLYALLTMAKTHGLDKVFVHAFLDGRDVPPQSASIYLESLEEKIAGLGTGRIASITGRYYAMDRDKRWDRTQAAYDMLTLGKARSARDWRDALDTAYAEGETDEFVLPTVLGYEASVVQTGDSLVFFNFRADRARQISHAFCDREFTAFPRTKHPEVFFAGMLRYEEELEGHFAYPPLILKNTLGEVISSAGLTQLRIAETEKYAHVTFFFSGKREDPFPGEDRCLIPSPKVATYDQKPEMSAPEVTDEVIKRIQGGKYDFVVLNYANPDMVGHTGCFHAAKRAVEVVDSCLGRLIPAVLAGGGAALIIADHGNVEELVEFQEGEEGGHTYHTSNNVPCILVTKDNQVSGRVVKGLRKGILADVAPTILEIMELDKPAEMDRDSLILY